MAALAMTSLVYGLVARFKPHWDTATDGGSRALTVQRVHYWLIMQCPFRILEPTIESLAEFGLIGNSSVDPCARHLPMRDVFDFRGLVLPASLESIGAEIAFFDDSRRRRIFTNAICRTDDLQTVMSAVSDDRVLARALENIEQAEFVSEESLLPFRLISLRSAAKDAVPPLEPICVAAGSGDRALVRYLLNAGTDVNLRDCNNCTPLSWAADKGHEDVVKYLLAHGADASITDKDGDSPLDLAQQQGHTSIVTLLQSVG
jgi:hypothetical protein